MALHVDDRLIASNNLEIIVATKGWLIPNFDIKDMGDVSFVLKS